MDGLDRARLFLVFREALDFKWVYGMLSVPGCFCVLSVLRSRFAVHDTVFFASWSVSCTCMFHVLLLVILEQSIDTHYRQADDPRKPFMLCVHFGTRKRC